MAYKVVIIDDEPWTREVIKSLVEWEEIGLELVGEASDGEFGYELIQQLSPDIVLTDVCMPHLNGIELMTRLRREGKDTLVIIISGYDDFDYIRGALKLGATDYLLKPIKAEELNSQLKHCAEILDAESGQEQHNVALTGDFLNVKWADDFYSLRESACDAIHSYDENIIRSKFELMRQLISENEKGSIGKEILICIYYTLMNALQRTISGRGFILREVFGTKETSFVFRRENTLNEILDFICDLYCYAADSMLKLQRSRNKLDINKVRHYIDEHFTEGITLEDTAAKFYVSKEYLSKVFKAEVGEGFSEYVTAKRMKKAKELILDYRIPIKEAGEMVGYLDQAHFYKVFKKYYGKTPGEIREN